MRLLPILIVSLVSCTTTFAYYDDGALFCAADQVSGFKSVSDGVWQQAFFNTKDLQYVVRPETFDEYDGQKRAGWAVRQMDNQHQLPDFGPQSSGCVWFRKDELHCGDAHGSFSISTKTNRYQRYYKGAHIHSDETNRTKPAIEIGKCQVISELKTTDDKWGVFGFSSLKETFWKVTH